MSTVEEQRRRLKHVRRDFEVRYRFFSTEEGGRRTGPPAQLYRSDWLYDGDDIGEGLYMIWPIFLDENGEDIEPNAFVSVEGRAQMFIVNDEFRVSLHAKRLKPGVRGYFMEGPHRVAKVTVTKLLAISELSSQ